MNSQFRGSACPTCGTEREVLDALVTALERLDNDHNTDGDLLEVALDFGSEIFGVFGDERPKTLMCLREMITTASARDKMSRARTALILNEPFYGALLLRFRLTPSEDIAEIAADSGGALLFNAQYICRDSLTVELLSQRLSLLAHTIAASVVVNNESPQYVCERCGGATSLKNGTCIKCEDVAVIDRRIIEAMGLVASIPASGREPEGALDALHRDNLREIRDVALTTIITTLLGEGAGSYCFWADENYNDAEAREDRGLFAGKVVDLYERWRRATPERVTNNEALVITASSGHSKVPYGQCSICKHYGDDCTGTPRCTIENAVRQCVLPLGHAGFCDGGVR